MGQVRDGTVTRATRVATSLIRGTPARARTSAGRVDRARRGRIVRTDLRTGAGGDRDARQGRRRARAGGGLAGPPGSGSSVGLFLAGLLALAFGYGVAVGKGLLFPHVVINNAVDAARDWRENWRQYLGLRSEFVLPTARTAGGVTRYDRAAAWPGDTFLTMFHDGRFGAVLVDMEGRELHRWDVAVSRIWPGQTVFDGVRLADDDVDIHGTALLPNGDAILNLGEAGTVRVDRCSRVLWKVPGETHHAVDPLPDGETLVPARHRRTRATRPGRGWGPGRTGSTGRTRCCASARTARSRRRWRCSTCCTRAAGRRCCSPGRGRGRPSGRRTRPTSTTPRRCATEVAPAFPMFRAGDVLLSLRNLDTLVVADPRTWRVKWAMTGPFLGQHDPDFLPNGHLLVFDNRGTGDRPAFGGSRVLEIDPATREVVWSYDGGGGSRSTPGSAARSRRCRTATCW